MQNELDILREVSERLESASIAFMLTGSVAMNFYAQPRMTRDIDLVISLSPVEIESFARLFEDNYYLDRQSIGDAIMRRTIFNLIHNDSVIKVDFIVLKSGAYRQEEFSRRRRVTIDGFQTWIVSREDLILSKLWWARDSGSEMQMRDVRNLLTPDCDQSYLQNQATKLGISDLLSKAQDNNE